MFMYPYLKSLDNKYETNTAEPFLEESMVLVMNMIKSVAQPGALLSLSLLIRCRVSGKGRRNPSVPKKIPQKIGRSVAHTQACVFVCVCTYTPSTRIARSLSLSLSLSLALSLITTKQTDNS
jgi:hypothetical protein